MAQGSRLIAPLIDRSGKGFVASVAVAIEVGGIQPKQKITTGNGLRLKGEITGRERLGLARPNRTGGIRSQNAISEILVGLQTLESVAEDSERNDAQTDVRIPSQGRGGVHLYGIAWVFVTPIDRQTRIFTSKNAIFVQITLKNSRHFIQGQGSSVNPQIIHHSFEISVIRPIASAEELLRSRNALRQMSGIRPTHFTITIEFHNPGLVDRSNDVLPFVQTPEILSVQTTGGSSSPNRPFGLV